LIKTKNKIWDVGDLLGLTQNNTKVREENQLSTSPPPKPASIGYDVGNIHTFSN